MRRIYLYCLAAVVAVVAVACTAVKPMPVAQTHSINLALIKDAPANKYVGMEYGIRLYVNDSRSTSKVLTKYDASAISLPQVRVSPDVHSFVSESMRRYMRTMGFNLDADVSTDYMLNVAIKEFNLGYLSGVGWSATVSLDVCVYDANRQLVYPNVVAVGRASGAGSAYDFSYGNGVLNTAYNNALEDIDWDRIAYFLDKKSSPSMEANKQVSGEGNTSLESTVIRWYLDSSPRGADISLRVVSSTPDVKNTNQNYVGSTPYETTETFDIIGLTYNNSGNVQIEVTCEKAGYITQKKRFNLRQAIDQKEISTKFNLIKEE